jgi:hypothetical protein
MVAGADAQASVSERKPTGTPASAQDRCCLEADGLVAERVNRAGDETHDGPAAELLVSRGHDARHLDDAARHLLADHIHGLEVLARVGEDRRGFVERP